MGQPIEITRTELSVSALRALAGKTDDGAVVRRLLAVALVLEGRCRTEAASLNGMTRQTLRDWDKNPRSKLRGIGGRKTSDQKHAASYGEYVPREIHRYNGEGVEGLRSRTGPGRPPFLTDARMEELREMVLKGPDPERHIVMRWRCADLCEEVAERWSVKVCEQTIGRWLRRLEMTRLQPRPYHPKKDPEAEVAFKKTSAGW
jgi:transposase